MKVMRYIKKCSGGFLFLSILMLAALATGKSHAEEAGNAEKAAKAHEARAEAQNPHIEELQKVAEELVEGLDESSLKVLYEIRQIFGITRSVRIVRSDVEKAVNLCAEENEEMADEIKARFSGWDKAVMPRLESAEGRMQVMVEAQSFRPAADIREYLSLTKKAADYAESRIEKRPVTSAEECRALIRSMDNTEEALVSLLAGIDEDMTRSAPSSDTKESATEEDKD